MIKASAWTYRLWLGVILVFTGIMLYLSASRSERTISVFVDDREIVLRIPNDYIRYLTAYGNPEMGNVSLEIDKRGILRVDSSSAAKKVNNIVMSIRLRSTSALYEEMMNSRQERTEYEHTIYSSNDFIVKSRNGSIANMYDIVSIKEKMLVLYGDFNKSSKVLLYATCWPRLFRESETGRCEAYLETAEGINVTFLIPFMHIGMISTYGTLVRTVLKSFLEEGGNTND